MSSETIVQCSSFSSFLFFFFFFFPGKGRENLEMQLVGFSIIQESGCSRALPFSSLTSRTAFCIAGEAALDCNVQSQA